MEDKEKSATAVLAAVAMRSRESALLVHVAENDIGACAEETIGSKDCALKRGIIFATVPIRWSALRLSLARCGRDADFRVIAIRFTDAAEPDRFPLPCSPGQDFHSAWFRHRSIPTFLGSGR